VYLSCSIFSPLFSSTSLVSHGETLLKPLPRRSANGSGGRPLRNLQKETTLKKSEGICSLLPITTSVTQAFLPALCIFHILVFNKVSRSFIAYTNTVLISAEQFTVRFWKKSEVTDASKYRGGLLEFDHELSKRRQPLTLLHGANAESASNVAAVDSSHQTTFLFCCKNSDQYALT
jgi:hypothetical protein